jgi:hypothetical protein
LSHDHRPFASVRLFRVFRVEPSFRVHLFEMAQRATNPFDQRRVRQRTDGILQRRVVEVVRERDLPFAERDEFSATGSKAHSAR